MNSPRLGGKGRTSARGTPRMGTPTGGSGSFIPPAPKGTLVLGKGKAKLRAVADASPLEPSTNMLMSREASYDVADAELFHSRIGSYQPAGKTVGEKGRIFAKSEEMTASFHEPIPLDVIRAAGVDERWKDTCIGGYDTATGYTWVASGRNTWIWRHQRNPPMPPTVHVFGSPPTTSDTASPPHVILLPLEANTSNEPALLLVSPTGHFRFWPSIYLGLSGADRFVEETLPLAKAHSSKQEEIITIAEVLIPSLALTSINISARNVMGPEIIVGTSKGRVFRVFVTRRGEAGEWAISINQVAIRSSKTTGLLSGLFNFGAPALPRFGSGSSSPTIGNIPTLDTEESDSIVGITMGAVQTEGVDAWILTSSSLAVWRVSDARAPLATSNSILGTERLICKAEALSGIQSKLLEMLGVPDDADDAPVAGQEDRGSMAGTSPWQMERREKRLLAMGVELLDIALVKSKPNNVDPREPSTAGSRDDDEMDTEAGEDEEELNPVILVAYTPPLSRYGNNGGISWRSRGVPTPHDNGQTKRRERLYATIACQFVGVEGLAGNLSGSISGTPTLRFDEPVPLPYSDGGHVQKSPVAMGLNRGVGLGFGVGGAPGTKQGCFMPRLKVLQTKILKEIRPEGADEQDADLVNPFWKEIPVTVLVSIFEGGMVITTNDGPFRDHLFMKQMHPFPRSVGFGVVGRSLKSGATFTPYALSAARLSSSSLVRPQSRSQILPPSYPQVTSNPSIGEIAYITTMGIVTVALDFEKISSVDERSGGSNQIRSVMEQAVLYGPIPDNPFAFRFSSNVNPGHLMIAASQLSQETLESSPKLIKRQLGLTTHLEDRAARLDWLIQFINDNGALNRLNIPLRTTLATHAEKIAAAQGVWAWYDGTKFKGPPTAAGVGSRTLERSRNMLLQAVDLYQEQYTNGSDETPAGTIGGPDGDISLESDDEHEGDGVMGWNHVHWRRGNGDEDENNFVGAGYVDPVRAFFKVKVERIGELIPFSVKVVKSTVTSFEKTQTWPDVMVQAGRLALVLLEAALQFRKSHYTTYGLDPDRPASTPWTAEPHILDACQYLFEEVGKAAGDAAAESETQEVLQGLATVICEGFRDQLEAIPSRTSMDWTNVTDRFILARRKVWGLLVQHGAAAHAFKLAEEYADFPALADLCYQASTHSIQSPSGERVKKVNQIAVKKRIDHYLEQFKQEFAFELYRWWIEHDMAYEIFKQSDIHGNYVEAFFSHFDNPTLGWLHQIGKRQFTAASATLQSLSQAETRLGAAKFLLSMGKLCELVELKETKDIREMDEEIQGYDEMLDLLDVQQKLRDDLLQSIAQEGSSLELDSENAEILARASIITQQFTARLQDSGRSESSLLFKRLVANLIGDIRLGVEDTVDILSLKDNLLDARDYAVAVHLIYDAKSLPAARQEVALRTLWRRVYLRDDWNELSDTRSYTDAEVTDRLRSTALFTTLRDLYTGPLSDMLDSDSISKLIRTPAEALDVPSLEELVDRYSQCGYYGEDGYASYTQDDVAVIHMELEREREQLEQFVSVLEGGLREEVARIEESERPSEESAVDVKLDSSPAQIIRGNSLGLDVEME